MLEATTGDPHAPVPCPACRDEGGEPAGEVLAQLPSGTWIRKKCDICRGRRKLDDDGLARYRARVWSCT
jgi:hypothetical protein